jgi:hypothetical protein
LIHCGIAHESAHSFGIGDEYGTEEGPPPATLEDYVNAHPNLHTRGAVFDASGRVVVPNIRWAGWVRIAKAGILDTGPVHRGGNDVRIHCRRGTAWQFEAGDIVRLRRARLTPVNPPSRSATPEERRVNPLMSDRLRVVRCNGDELDLLWLGTLPLNFGDYGPGDRLICPVRAPDVSPGVLGDDRRLVPPNIESHMMSTGLPLASYDPASADSLPQVPTSLPSSVRGQPRIRANIIGLYEGGAEYYRGVFHPSGLCIMRGKQPTGVAARFCHVCRYALVDQIDPTKHRDIECAFAEQYPDPPIAPEFGDICRRRYVIDRERLRRR